MTAGPAHDVGPTADGDAQPPIRWPRPDRLTLALGAVWLVGMIVALVVPALVQSPSVKHPTVARTWFAFLFTAVGSAVMFASGLLHFRRKRDASLFTLGTVAAVSLFLGGIILVATKLGGGYGQG